MNDHDNTPTPDDPMLTAYALGELDPQSDEYQAIEAKLSGDASLREQVEQIARLGNQLSASYEQSAGPGLDDTALHSIIDASDAPIARIRPRRSLTRRLLPYAGVAACTSIATAGIFIAMQPKTPQTVQVQDEDKPEIETVVPEEAVVEAPKAPPTPKEKLEQRITLVQEAAPLGEIIDDISEQTGTNVVVNWPAAELVGVEPDSLVSIKLRDVPASTVLRLVLDQASADAFDDDKLGLRTDEHIVKVSTLRDLKSETDTRVYDVRDLLVADTNLSAMAQVRNSLMARIGLTGSGGSGGGGLFADDGGGDLFTGETLAPGLATIGPDSYNLGGRENGTLIYDERDLLVEVPNFSNAPGFDLNDALSSKSSGASNGGQGGLFGDDSDADYDDQDEDLPSRQELVDQYVELINVTVGDPDEWLDEESTLTELNGNLIVKTTDDNHEQIQQLLGIMRERKGLGQDKPVQHDQPNQEEVRELVALMLADIEKGMFEVERRRELRELERERRERFAELNDNPFKLVDQDPLSTFSVDVDTASYAYGRRAILTDRTLPTPDSIRIEEWINYFDYGYTAPVVDPDALPNGRLTTEALEKLEAADETFVPFNTDVEVAQCPWTEGNQLVRIGIKAMEVDQTDRPPAHLVFLLDVSGSMDSQDKLGLVQRGMPMLLDQLNDNDKVSIVVYAGASGLVLEAAEAADKNKIRDAIAALKAGGSTAGAEGIQLAYEMAEKHFVEGGVNRVILCTDGDFNVGTSDTDELVELVKSKANPEGENKARGVYLSVMGFGTGNLNDEMMEKITNAGNGNYHYIDSVNEAVKTMSQQAGGTLVTVAKDVKLQLEFNPAKVASYRLIGYENRVLRNEDFNNDTVDAGDIGAGHSVTALYEIVPVKVQAEKPEDEQADIDELRYQKPRDLADAAELPELLTLKLRYKPVDAAAEQGTSRKVVTHVPAEAVAFDKASEATRFASSVAAMGMILRGSPHRGTASSQWVAETIVKAKEHDPNGYRDEFFKLATQVGILETERDEAFRKDLVD